MGAADIHAQHNSVMHTDSFFKGPPALAGPVEVRLSQEVGFLLISFP
jgi:hypothetical protein